MKNIKGLFRIFSLLLCLAVIVICSITAFAAPARVVDDAGILTDSEEAGLTERLNGIEDKYGHDVAIVTVRGLNGKSVQSYADDYFDNHGYGTGSDKSGILLLVDMSSRQYAMTTHGEMMDMISESNFTSLENAFVDDLSDGYYYESFSGFADKCEHLIKYENRLSPVWILVALLIGAAVAGIVIWCMQAKHKSVKAKKTANDYVRRETFRVSRSRDVFLYSHVTRTRRAQNSSSGSRGGGGGSHGGRSGRF